MSYSLRWIFKSYRNLYNGPGIWTGKGPEIRYTKEDDASAIEKLLGCLSSSERQLALRAGIDATHRYVDIFKQANILITLTTLLPKEERENVLPDIIHIISKIRDATNRTQTIIEIIPLLQAIKSRPLICQVFSIIEKIDHPQERWKALIAISDCETKETRQRIMQQVLDESRYLPVEQRFQVVLSVINKIPLEESVLILSEMIDNALLLEEDKYNNLHPWSDIAGSMGDTEHPRIKALVGLIPYIPPELTNKLLLITRKPGDSSDQSIIMKRLVLHVQKTDPSKLYEIWNEALHVFASRTRAELFKYLGSIAPILFLLGDLNSLQELNDMIAELS